VGNVFTNLAMDNPLRAARTKLTKPRLICWAALKLALQALDEGREYQGEILEVMDAVRSAIEKAEVEL